MPPFDRPLPLAIGASHLFGDRPKGHDLDLRRLDNATRPLRAVQQHSKRAYEGNIAVGVVPERGGGERLRPIQDQHRSLVGGLRGAPDGHREGFFLNFI